MLQLSEKMMRRVSPGIKTVFKPIVSDMRGNWWSIKSGFLTHLRQESSSHPNKVLFNQTIDAQGCQKLVLKTHEHPVNISSVESVNKIINIKVTGDEDQSKSSPAATSHYGISVTKYKEFIYIECDKTYNEKNLQVNVNIPYIPNLDFNSFDTSDLRMSHMDCHNVTVNTEKGSFSCYNIKCNAISAYSMRGSIISDGYIMGNTYLRTDNGGSIIVNRIQGKDIEIKCNNGNVTVGSMYAEKFFLNCQNSNASLTNVHGQCRIEMEAGNLQLAGMDGHLTASVSRGDARIQISKLNYPSQNVIMVFNGNAELNLNPELVASLRLEGKDVIMESEANVSEVVTGTKDFIIYEGNINGGKLMQNPHIVCISHHGKVNFGLRTWLENLKKG